MLWTVFRDLPFEQRLEKVAEAGYKNVELVGEYQKWSEADYVRANAKRKELGISFDATAGLKHGVANPADRNALLADLREALVSMEKLDCPSIILLSGDVAPGVSRAAQHQSCIDSLQAAAKLVEGKKIAGEPVRLLLETIDPLENPKYYLTSANEAFEIVKAVNSQNTKLPRGGTPRYQPSPNWAITRAKHPERARDMATDVRRNAGGIAPEDLIRIAASTYVQGR